MNIIRIVFLLSCVLLTVACKKEDCSLKGDWVALEYPEWKTILSEPQKAEFIKYLQTAGVKDMDSQRVSSCDLNADGTLELIFTMDTDTGGQTQWKILTWKDSNEWSEIGEIPFCIAVFDDGGTWKYFSANEILSDNELCDNIYRYSNGKYRLTEKVFKTYHKIERGIQIDKVIRVEKIRE